MMKETRVESWCDLQAALFDEAWSPALGRYRSKMAFRGLSDASYELQTTLRRLGGPYVELERHLLRNFVKYAAGSVRDAESVWHWLSVAQHHGLPTRLLDWTFSPLVALHFATVGLSQYHRDGVVWAVNYADTHAVLPDSLRSVLDAEGADVFTVEMLSSAAPTLAALAALSSAPLALFFEPPSLDARIVNQHALFSVMSRADEVLNRWLVTQPITAHRIVIPKELKWEVRDKLDQSNLTERVLMPGLDGLSSWLSRQYAPKERTR